MTNNSLAKENEEISLNHKLPTRLLTINQFIENHPFNTHGGLRYLIFNAKSNGMEKAKVIKRIGRKLLIDENNFFAWLEEINGGNHA